MVHTIDGLPGGMDRRFAPQAETEDVSGAAVMTQALGLIRVASLEGLKDAMGDMRGVVRGELFWVKVGVGVSAGVSLLILLGALANMARRRT